MYRMAAETPSVDLSVEAPVSGTYRYGSVSCIFGTGSASGNGYGYDAALARRRNQPPRTLAEFTNGSASRADRTIPSHSFRALTTTSDTFTGLQIHDKFFDNLPGNAEAISEWLKRSPNYRGDLDAFWLAVQHERDRMSKTPCPMIPYDQRIFN
ncbi:MAG: hypothetical protein AB8B83_09860 [Bdellovibrionales bacterium]